MDVFRPESPGINVPCQPLGPKPSDNPASAFPNFHQEDGNPMRATEPNEISMPRPAGTLLLPQQSHNRDISALFNFNYIFSRELASSFQRCLQAGLSITALPQRACHGILMSWGHRRAQDHAGRQEPILQQRSGDVPIHTGMGWGNGCRGERESFRGSRVGCGRTQKGRPQGCR